LGADLPGEGEGAARNEFERSVGMSRARRVWGDFVVGGAGDTFGPGGGSSWLAVVEEEDGVSGVSGGGGGGVGNYGLLDRGPVGGPEALMVDGEDWVICWTA
jgi:hypothetical protein